MAQFLAAIQVWNNSYLIKERNNFLCAYNIYLYCFEKLKLLIWILLFEIFSYIIFIWNSQKGHGTFYHCKQNKNCFERLQYVLRWNRKTNFKTKTTSHMTWMELKILRVTGTGCTLNRIKFISILKKQKIITKF